TSAHTHQRAEGARRSLYNADLIVPCLFNSGCVLGKRGMTSLEIRDGRIALVYWFDASRDDATPYRDTHGMEALPGTHYYRVVLEEDSLDYIFSRINLLE
ncbi:MAG: metallophosphoesterase, partial [Spirochaetia bacterium]